MLQRILMWVFKHRDIVKGGELYLRRFYLTPRRWPWKVMLHYIRKPDDDRDPHDHPWSFLTFVLWGGYHELVYTFNPTPDGPVSTTQGRFLTALSMIWRRAEHIHKISYLMKPTWTLVFAFKGRRVWGFWDALGSFIPWTKYLQREDGAVPESLLEDGCINHKARNA